LSENRVLPFLIDDRGKLWDPHSLVLRAQLHASVGTQELRDFAVLNLGFIALAIGKASFHIQLRPALAQPAALGALYLALHKHAPERIVVRWYNGVWQDEIIGWHSEGWRRLTHLFESPEDPGPGFSRRRIAPELLPRENPLRDVLADTSRLTRILANPARMLPASLSDRYLLLIENDDRDLRVCDFGSALMSRSPQWQSRARGRRIDDLPDWHYGQWVANAYREAGRSGQPVLEEVTAMIDWPRLGTLSHAYWRLIVTETDRGGRARLLGVTLDDARVRVHKAG
jgi:hypothetical protein